MPRTGRCACGSVRYELASEPYDAGWCHCRDCQLNSGSPAMAFASVPITDYVVTEGAELIARFDSSAIGQRSFCSKCGTPLLMIEKDHPTTLDFSLATLDNPDSVVPGFHIFYASRIAWANAGDDLPRHDRRRADSEGKTPC